MSRRRSLPATAPPLEDEDLLGEILLRLPTQPSALPRASAVCKRWRSILSDPDFLRRFRGHHQKPPLLGFFERCVDCRPFLLPMLDPPDRIPAARFSLSNIRIPFHERWDFQGCRHELAVLINQFQRKVVVVDPMTGQEHRIAFPLMGLDSDKNRHHCWYAAILCTDAEDGHVHGNCFSSPFKLALICNWDTHIFACLYESTSRVWGDIVYAQSIYSVDFSRPSVLIGNVLYWLLCRGYVLAFDSERQSIDVIEKPADPHITSEYYTIQLLRTKDSGLGCAVLAKHIIKLWERKLKRGGVLEWVLQQKTIQLEEHFPHTMQSDITSVLMVGYDEDTNVIVLSTMIGVFMLHVDTLQVKNIMKMDSICYILFYPYRNFYTTVRGVACGDTGAVNVNT